MAIKRKKQLLVARRIVKGKRSKLLYACKACREKFEEGYNASIHLHKEHKMDIDEAARQQLVALNKAQVITKPKTKMKFDIEVSFIASFDEDITDGRSEEQVVEQISNKLKRRLKKVIPDGTEVQMKIKIKEEW